MDSLSYMSLQRLPGKPALQPAQTEPYTSVALEFAKLAKHPPGGDPYMALCYLAAYELSQTEPLFIRLLTEVLSKRDIPPKHLANLFYRGVQLIELFSLKNRRYPGEYVEVAVWKKELREILVREGALLKEVLLHRNTTTTLYQRYAGAKALLSAWFPGQAVTVADFGCGGNYGLRGLDLGEPFQPFEDLSEGQLVEKYARSPFQLKAGIALDLEDPLAPEMTTWRLACSFYPQELTRLPEVLAFEERLQQSRRVTFYQRDLLSGNGFTQFAGQCDAVVISTLCYQIPQAWEQILARAMSFLKPDGLVIMQDFAVKERSHPRRLNFAVDWHTAPFSYRTFITGRRFGWEMQEILQWEDGRCAAVRPGGDFSVLQSA